MLAEVRHGRLSGHYRVAGLLGGLDIETRSHLALRNWMAFSLDVLTAREGEWDRGAIVRGFSACRDLMGWFKALRWQRPPEMERLGEFLLKHIEGIAAYCDHAVRFGVVEIDQHDDQSRPPPCARHEG